MMMRKIVILLMTIVLLVMSVTTSSAQTLITGDINADQKVDLRDVISVLRLMAVLDPGTISPGGIVDTDGRISLKEAVVMLHTIGAVNAFLQPYITAYLAALLSEQAVEDAVMQELEPTFYLNGDSGPAIKMPTIEFLDQSIDCKVDLGSYTPPDAPAEKIDSVKALLFDTANGEWGYGVKRAPLTMLLAETRHGDDFSATYSLLINGVQRIADGTVKDLTDIDPARGILLQVDTDAGTRFLVGSGNAYRISTAVSTRRPAAGNGIQDGAAQVGALPLTTGACPCPTVDILAQLQKSFAKQDVAFSADHLKIKQSQPIFTCGDSFKATIRLGSDLEILESPQKLGQRIKDNDFRLVEPAGYFRGPHYLLVLSFWSWWDQSSGTCICEFSWKFVQVSTGRILGAGFVTRPCGNLESDFDAMLGKIEGDLKQDLFLLSDADFQIPDCDDGNPCTWDAYDLNTRQCKHRAKAASPITVCDDDNPLTQNDVCFNGICKGVVPPPCISDSSVCQTGDSFLEGASVFAGTVFNLDPGRRYAAYAHSNGVDIVDLTTGSPVFSNIMQFFSLYGATVLPRADGMDILVGNGPKGLFYTFWTGSAFGMTIGIGRSNTTDVWLPPGSNGPGLVLSNVDSFASANIDYGQAAWFQNGTKTDTFGNTTPSISTINSQYGNWFQDSPGSVVSGQGGFSKGVFVLANDPNPGELWYGDPKADSSAVKIGDLGALSRRIRCAGGICVATNFGDDTVNIITWSDPDQPPVISGSVAVGDGPVGVDVRTAANGDVLAVTTGFNDDTFTILTIGTDGTVKSKNTTAVTGCEGPGHGMFLSDTRVFITCNTNGAFAIRTIR